MSHIQKINIEEFDFHSVETWMRRVREFSELRKALMGVKADLLAYFGDDKDSLPSKNERKVLLFFATREINLALKRLKELGVDFNLKTLR